MTKSLSKSVINLYSNLACSVLGVAINKNLVPTWSVTPFLTLLCKGSHAICTIGLALC